MLSVAVSKWRSTSTRLDEYENANTDVDAYADADVRTCQVGSPSILMPLTVPAVNRKRTEF